MRPNSRTLSACRLRIPAFGAAVRAYRPAAHAKPVVAPWPRTLSQGFASARSRNPGPAPEAAATELAWQSVFTPYRRRILYPIAAASTVIFLPLAVADFIAGHTLLAALLLAQVALLAIDALAMLRGKSPPIPFVMLLVPAGACVGLSLMTQGIYGALWSFPAMLLCYFVMARRYANLVGAAILAVGTAAMYAYQTPGVAVRFFLALSLCLLAINIILGVLESVHAKLVAQSIADPLTGAFNRRHMEACLGQAIERRSRSGAPAALLLLDIDKFKRINDRFGHEAGDRVLRSVVALIQERRRRLDLLFRIGGEEFVLLLPDTHRAEAMIVAETLRQAVGSARLIDAAQVTVSIGVAELQPRQSSHDWLRHADEALYGAKQSGRDKVIAFEERARHLSAAAD